MRTRMVPVVHHHRPAPPRRARPGPDARQGRPLGGRGASRPSSTAGVLQQLADSAAAPRPQRRRPRDRDARGAASRPASRPTATVRFHADAARLRGHHHGDRRRPRHRRRARCARRRSAHGIDTDGAHRRRGAPAGVPLGPVDRTLRHRRSPVAASASTSSAPASTRCAGRVEIRSEPAPAREFRDRRPDHARRAAVPAGRGGRPALRDAPCTASSSAHDSTEVVHVRRRRPASSGSDGSRSRSPRSATALGLAGPRARDGPIVVVSGDRSGTRSRSTRSSASATSSSRASAPSWPATRRASPARASSPTARCCSCSTRPASSSGAPPRRSPVTHGRDARRSRDRAPGADHPRRRRRADRPRAAAQRSSSGPASTVSVAADGVEALALARRAAVDLVLTDVRDAPDGRLRAHARRSAPHPSSGQPARRSSSPRSTATTTGGEGLEAGADGYIVKSTFDEARRCSRRSTGCLGRPRPAERHDRVPVRSSSSRTRPCSAPTSCRALAGRRRHQGRRRGRRRRPRRSTSSPAAGPTSSPLDLQIPDGGGQFPIEQIMAAHPDADPRAVGDASRTSGRRPAIDALAGGALDGAAQAARSGRATDERRAAPDRPQPQRGSS